MPMYDFNKVELFLRVAQKKCCTFVLNRFDEWVLQYNLQKNSSRFVYEVKSVYHKLSHLRLQYEFSFIILIFRTTKSFKEIQRKTRKLLSLESHDRVEENKNENFQLYSKYLKIEI